MLELKAKFLENKGVATHIPEELAAPGSWEQFQFLRFAGGFRSNFLLRTTYQGLEAESAGSRVSTACSNFYCDSICLTTVPMCVALKPSSLKTTDGALIVYREWNRFWGYVETQDMALVIRDKLMLAVE